MASHLCRSMSARLFLPRSVKFHNVLIRRPFHSSQPIYAVWFMTPLGRFAAAVGGRIARTVWRRLPEERKAAIKSSIVKRRQYLLGAGLVSLFGGFYYYSSHLESVPLTQRRRFMMYNREDVLSLLKLESEGRESDYLSQFIDAKAILPPDHPTYKSVKRVLTNVLHSNSWCKELTHIDSWRLIVAENETVNAISLPTGDIIVFTGLIEHCRNQDELGLIVSHEVAHVVLNHGSESLSHNGLISFLGLFVISAIWFIVPSDIVSFVLHQLFNSTSEILFRNPYSQVIELEADKVGFMFASAACYNPEKSVSVWTHFPEMGMEDYLSTHPRNEKRLAVLTSILPEANKLYKESDCSTAFMDFTRSIVKFVTGNR